MKNLYFLLILLCPLFAIAQPCATINSFVPTPTSCMGTTDGGVTVAATSNATPITYTLGATTNATGVFTGLAMGIYTVVATDANNCSDSIAVPITSPAPLSINSINAISPSCNPGNDGSICLTASGGTGALSYSLLPISTPQFINCFNNLSAGIYTATVTDANGCNANTTVAITTPQALVISTLPILNTNPCDPDTINAIVTGGTLPAVFTITPNVGTQLSSGFFIIPAGGTYTITATDANNCSVSTIVSLNTNAPQSVASSFVNPQCGSNNGSITANVSWPGTTFNYILNPGNTTSTTGIYNNLGPGTYTVSAQGPSCSFVVDTFILSSKLNPYPISTTQNTFTATVPTNGTAPYLYTLNSQVIPNPLSGMRCTGVDTFRITDAGGCSFDTTFSFVAANNFPGITLNKNITDASCALTGDGQIIYAPSAILTYDWMANSAVVGSTSNNITSLMPDVYVVKLHNAAGDCIQDTSTVGAVGTNCGNISGKTFYDHLNINCSLDTLELLVPNALVTLMPGNIQTITNANGEFQFNGLAYGNYVVEVDTNIALTQYSSCNLIQYDTLSASNNSITNNFPYDSVTNINLYAYTFAMPKVPAAPLYSFLKTQGLNYGSTTTFLTSPIAVNVYALMDSIKHYHSASITPTAINGDTLMWSTTITGFWNPISVYFDSLQSLTINQQIPFKVWIEAVTPIPGNDLSNDTSSVLLPILTSYDPNDKQVSPQGFGAEGFIDPNQKELSYLIRFQNTGNAMAYNVAIEDTISNLLDINSLRVLGASHNYLIEKDNNLIRFKFNNIMLPDSNANEPNSHGFIQYTIEQDAGNLPGDEINNTAYIYFDYNPAVVTNTTLNTIPFPISVEDISRSNFKVYPNPTHDIIYISSATNEIKSVVIYDLLGREVISRTNNTLTKALSVSLESLPLGVYLMQVNDHVMKIIKQ